MRLQHIAINVSSEEGVNFYKDLGFTETSRTYRENHDDYLIWMNGHGITLEIFLSSTRYTPITKPGSYGLKHLAFDVDNFEELRKMLKTSEEIREFNGTRFFFAKDPDGLSIEFREVK